MPIPKPKANEDKDTFISRCLSDEKTKEEFPKAEQCIAVCSQQWSDKDKKKD